MPKLEKGILDVLNGGLNSAVEVARGLSQAYFDYASGAMAGPGTVVLTPVQLATLQGTLLPALSPMTGSAPTFAAAWAAGLTAFWPGVPIIGAATGAVLVCAGAASIPASLVPVLLNPHNTAEIAAKGMAAALHAATLTTTASVLIPPAPSPVVVTLL